ncbi:MAG TPA: MoaD/ThiS family protein [Caldimonas sp.]|nr:MoaD/ThiS family protein [Caldimonas sp.]
MNVDVRYFAAVREALGSGERVEVGAGATVASLRDALARRGGRHAEALGRERVLRSARNRVLCGEETELADGDEVGFFPPLTGG